MEKEHTLLLISAAVAISILHPGTASSQKIINNLPTRQTSPSWLHNAQGETVKKLELYGRCSTGDMSTCKQITNNQKSAIGSSWIFEGKLTDHCRPGHKSGLCCDDRFLSE